MTHKTKNLLLMALAVIVVILITYCTITLNNKNKDEKKKPILDENAVDISPAPEELKNEPKNIKIPVEDTLTFNYNSKTQKVSFVNPEENNCLFIVTLSLENGDIIYKSNQIPPGKAIYTIEPKI